MAPDSRSATPSPGVTYEPAAGTLPRLRTDQLMGFAWKILLPMSILNIAVVGLWHFMSNKPLAWVVTAGILVLAFVVLSKISAAGNIEKRTYRYVS